MSIRKSILYIRDKIHVYDQMDCYSNTPYKFDFYNKNEDGYTREELLELAKEIVNFFDKPENNRDHYDDE